MKAYIVFEYSVAFSTSIMLHTWKCISSCQVISVRFSSTFSIIERLRLNELTTFLVKSDNIFFQLKKYLFSKLLYKIILQLVSFKHIWNSSLVHCECCLSICIDICLLNRILCTDGVEHINVYIWCEKKDRLICLELRGNYHRDKTFVFIGKVVYRILSCLSDI